MGVFLLFPLAARSRDRRHSRGAPPRRPAPGGVVHASPPPRRPAGRRSPLLRPPAWLVARHHAPRPLVPGGAEADLPPSRGLLPRAARGGPLAPAHGGCEPRGRRRRRRADRAASAPPPRRLRGTGDLLLVPPALGAGDRPAARLDVAQLRAAALEPVGDRHPLRGGGGGVHRRDHRLLPERDDRRARLSMRLRTQCRACGLPFAAVVTPASGSLACPGCGAAREVAAQGWSDAPGTGAVEVCPLCGCRHLYRQRDFNRGLGCLLVAVGAALVPWTFGLSLPVFGLVDLWLYRRLRDAVVCYRCDTVYR